MFPLYWFLIILLFILSFSQSSVKTRIDESIDQSVDTKNHFGEMTSLFTTTPLSYLS